MKINLIYFSVKFQITGLDCIAYADELILFYTVKIQIF